MENIQFEDDRERELFARAALGQQVIDFLATPVGKYLHGRCRNEVEQCEVDALEVLTEIDIPILGKLLARRKMRKIVQRAEIAKNFMRYLADAITDGDQAAKELDDYTPER
jgi:hypothetical protein